ncbi:hypothetical protein [Scytonema sp. NUACC26]|uniref:hypothetical protein n=1 Tax=Scytonema sp. NUACC26 TaxID=3140176 RepID=UPI0034DB937F
MGLPIVIVHRGFPEYLLYSLAQAQKFNPKSDIFLLGDNSNSILNFIHHENIYNYYTKAKLFEKIYSEKHLSFNDYEYELFCFQRWFIIQEFMIKNKIDSCIHLDSDLMTYVNVTEEFSKKFEKYSFTLSKKGSGHNSYIKYSGLEKICEHIMSYYTNPELFEILTSIREKALLAGQKAGGICDMTLLNQYYQRYSQEIGSTSDIINDSVYDANINSSDGFEMREGIKNIFWVDGLPFCRHLESGKEIRFNSLHFQSQPKKHIMKNYFTENKRKIIYYILINKMNRLYTKSVQKFWRV